MSNKSPRPQAVVHLDIDWLAGKRPDPRWNRPERRKRSPLWGLMLIAVFVALGAGLWTPLSKLWLQSQWMAYLQESQTTPEDALAVMLSLNALGDDNRTLIVSQLNDANAERREMAFQTIRQSLNTTERSENKNVALAPLASDLASLNGTWPDSIQRKAQLASDILRIASRSEPNFDQIESSCHAMIKAADAYNANQLNIVAGRLTDSSQPNAPRSELPEQTFVDSSITQRPQRMAPIVQGSISSASNWSTEQIPPPPGPVSTIALASNSPRRTVAKLSNVGSSATLSDTPSPNASTENNSVAKPSSKLTSHAKPPIVAFANEAASLRLSDTPEVTPNENLGNQTLDLLFPMLGSTQDRRVRMVCDELSQRGISNPLIELAIELARGDSRKQLQVLDQVVRLEGSNSTPVLVWMAQSKDRAVRQRAISLLGSMQDRETVQSLRILATREPDLQLRKLIEQAVASHNNLTR